MSMASQASSAHMNLQDAPDPRKGDALHAVLRNLDVEQGHIASYQWKGPFELLETESYGAFLHSWWAMVDGLVTPRDERTDLRWVQFGPTRNPPASEPIAPASASAALQQ